MSTDRNNNFGRIYSIECQCHNDTVLRVRSLSENHGRNERPRNIRTDDRKENIGTRQRRRTLENKNKEGRFEGAIFLL